MTKDKKPSTLQIILPVITAIFVAYIGYLGIKYQADSSKNSSPESTVDEATIKFVVLDKVTGNSITGATITLQIDVMPSEVNVTDTDGVARFFLKSEFIGLHGFLRIEADGYKSQKRDIDIDEKKPYVVYLEAETSETSATSSEIPAGNNTQQPTSTPTEITGRLTSTDTSYQEAITWIKQNNQWGPYSQIVSDFRDQMDSGVGNDMVVCKIGWGLTKTGKAYETKWIPDRFIVTEFPPTDAASQGFDELSMECTVTSSN